MSKGRIFVSGDPQQTIYPFNLTVLEAKHHVMSIEHLLPRELLIPGVSDYAQKPDDASLIMPEIGHKLLPFILPKKLRAAVAGDLAEDFRTFATQWGRPYALRWLCWEIGGLCIRRFGPIGIVTAVVMWFRQKLGW
jgi:hypothetical protein